MLKFLTPMFVAAACMGLSAGPAQAQSTADLMGSWSCAMTTPDGGQTQIVTTYRPDATFVTLVDMTQRTNDVEVRMVMVAEGPWSLVGAQLTETVATFDVIWVKVAGVVLTPGDETWTRMMGAMNSDAGTPNVRTVTALSPASLSVEYQGDRLTCARP